MTAGRTTSQGGSGDCRPGLPARPAAMAAGQECQRGLRSRKAARISRSRRGAGTASRHCQTGVPAWTASQDGRLRLPANYGLPLLGRGGPVVKVVGRGVPVAEVHRMSGAVVRAGAWARQQLQGRGVYADD